MPFIHLIIPHRLMMDGNRIFFCLPRAVNLSRVRDILRTGVTDLYKSQPGKKDCQLVDQSRNHHHLVPLQCFQGNRDYLAGVHP